MSVIQQDDAATAAAVEQFLKGRKADDPQASSAQAVPAEDPKPQGVSPTQLFIFNFAQVYDAFETAVGFGKSIKSPKLDVVLVEAAKYAHDLTRTQISLAVQQQQAAQVGGEQ